MSWASLALAALRALRWIRFSSGVRRSYSDTLRPLKEKAHGSGSHRHFGHQELNKLPPSLAQGIEFRLDVIQAIMLDRSYSIFPFHAARPCCIMASKAF